MQLLQKLQGFARSRQGNFGIMTAIILPVVLLCASISLDFLKLSDDRNRLQAAADSAALTVSNAYAGGTTDAALLQKLAEKFISANVSLGGTNQTVPTVALTISNATPKTATVTASMDVELMMAGIIGKQTQGISVSTTTTLSGPSYIQVAFLIDNSNSMSIPGTPAELIRWTNINGGCQFACHDTPTIARGEEDGLAAAKRYGIKLKMDFIRDALGQFMSKLEPLLQPNTHSLQLGIYTVGTTFQTVVPMTDNRSIVDAKLPLVEVEGTWPTSGVIGPQGGDGWTYLSEGLQIMGKKLTNIGDGTSPTKRKTYVVFMTDGVDSYPWYRTFGIKYAPDCIALQNMGVTMLTVQTYYPPSTDVQLKESLKRVPVALSQCASNPQNYLMAEDGPKIQSAVNRIFDLIFKAPRIMN